MKILATYPSYPTNERPKALTAQLVKTMKFLENNFGYLVQSGWQAIIEVDSRDGACYRLDLQCDRGGGTYAVAKMNTMECLGVDHSGYIDIDTTVQMLERLTDGQQNVPKQISQIAKYHDPDELPDHLAEWMRDELQFAPYLGGISVPFDGEVLNDDANELMPVKGTVRIAFSGASQEQDVMFATYLLETVTRAMHTLDENCAYSFNIDYLQDVPPIRLWLDLLLKQ